MRITGYMLLPLMWMLNACSNKSEKQTGQKDNVIFVKPFIDMGG